MGELRSILIEKEQSERRIKTKVNNFVRDIVFKRTFRGLFFEN